ncbi:MAG: peptidase T [Clostridia bacterium]
MELLERFLKYTSINTQCDRNSKAIPTNQNEFIIANVIADELKELGIEVTVNEHAHVYGKLPATPGYEDKMPIGFIAHMDTSPDFSGECVKPQIIENYQGQDVKLGDTDRVLSAEKFPNLKDYIGRTLITTDGTTLLGADDKAGVAEIVELAKILVTNNIPHGQVSLGFTPDEEGGDGISVFNVEEFGATVAYTCDGSTEGEVEYENFNAATVLVNIEGFNVHPGSAKDTMINASLVAMEFNSMLPSLEVPSHTEDFEGFYHLCEMSGDNEKAKLFYIVRDHDITLYEGKIKTVKLIEKVMNEKYGVGTVTLEIIPSYRNMKEKVEPHMHLIDNAKKAIAMAGLEPETKAIRGGTDGAALSYKGLPCPNLGTGGQAFHGPYEHITLEGMEISTQIILNIVKNYAK